MNQRASGGPPERVLGEPIDRLFAFYAGLSAIPLLFPSRPDGWILLLSLHVAVVGVGFAAPPAVAVWNRLATKWPRVAQLVGDWYPLALIPALYAELALLNHAAHGGRYFDSAVIGLEQAIFGGQPSRDWAAGVPNLALSELLHAAYLSYYLFIYLPPVILYVLGRREEFRRCVFALMLTFVAHYLFFIYFPVQGPRYLFAPPEGILATGFFYELTHRMLEAASSQGSAFPSSHVGIAVAQTVMVGRTLGLLVVPAALLTTGLALGAVYAGFHYAIDALLGAALGALAVLASPRLYQWLARTRRRV